MASSLVHERWLAGSQLGDATLFPEDRDRINRTWNVFKLVDENPKRGASRARFALYRNGMSVEEYIQAVVERGGEERVALEDICWDLNHKFIAVREPAKAWTVAEAKARLSEILRLARAGQPQTIGTEDACVIVSAAQFEQSVQSGHLGRYLIETAPRGFELELPSRSHDRGSPFSDVDGSF